MTFREIQFESLLSLGTGGHVVIDDFLSPGELDYWRALAMHKQESGVMRPAAIGQGRRRLVARAIRNDWIVWIEPDPGHAIEAKLAQRLEGLRCALNQQFMLGLFDLELHLTAYLAGGFYAAHVDRFRDDDHRIVSMIIYLNDGPWPSEDGGMLQIWSEGGPDVGPHIDIAPIGGRLVLFMAASTLHAVTATPRPRTALTGWFRRRD